MGRSAIALNPHDAGGGWKGSALRPIAIAAAVACLIVPPVVAQGTTRSRASSAYAALAGAFAALRTNDYDAAIAGFLRNLELTPARNDVRKNLAYAYFKVGKNELARRQFDEIVRRDSSDETAALELAFLDYDSPETAKRAQAYRLFNRLRAARDSGIRSRATIAFANADTSIALRIAQWAQAMRKEPENHLFSIKFARAAEERGLSKLAEEYYRGSASSAFPAESLLESS